MTLNKNKNKEMKAAVIIHGPGDEDGTDLTEFISLMINLTQNKIQVTCYAPDILQNQIFDHFQGKPMENELPRNVLIESCRMVLPGQKVLPLDECKASDHDGLFIPGGVGIDNELSDYGIQKGNMTVNPDVENVIKDFIS